jgi:uncharacterized membrane protein YphA (DoxX/SURF4 family)
MDNILKQGRLLFAIAIVAFGVENIVWARFGEAMVPVMPWVPGNPFLAYLTGVALFAAGLSIAANLRARLAAILLGMLFLVCVLFLQISRVAPHPLDVGIRTGAFETLAMSGAALTLAATLPADWPYSGRWEGAVNSLIKSGRVLFAASSVIFGIDHFLVLALIVSLVPSWIPGAGLFWAYFTGMAFIAAGVCIAMKWIARWAAALLGTMFLLWFLLLHAPRIMSFPRARDPREWSSAFIALGMCGGSWIVASALSAKASPRVLDSKRH